MTLDARRRRSSPPTATAPARWRLWLVAATLATTLLFVLWKGARLQLLLGKDLRALAEEQYLRKTPLTAPRGQVQDKDGRPLAISVPAWSVFAEPRRIVDADATAQRVAAVLGVPVQQIASKVSVDRAFVWLQRRVAPDTAEAVRALDLPGVGLRKEWRRAWPNKQLAAQLLGMVDVDGAGRGGVEQALDDRLASRTLKVDAIVDSRGDRIASAGVDPVVLEGDDVVLTIDQELQQAAEEALFDIIAQTQAKGAWALVMDVDSGAVRAVAQAPSFNPNNGVGDRRNRVFAEAFEPGSIFKIATFAAAFEHKAISPDDRIYCEEGRFQLGKHVIHDAHKAGWLTAREVFAQSSNIGTLKIAQKIGEDTFRTALGRYGFGARPGTGLIEESAGRLPQQPRWGEARLATVSFGHGLLVSALQMASFVQAVGNDGVRKRPYLIERVVAATGEIIEEHREDSGERILSVDVARTLRSIMESVAEAEGTGALAAIPGVRVAGKTGTAEKVDPVTGRYSRDLHLSSFVGLAPADRPRLVAIVVVDEPKGQAFGGLVAAPAWRRIVQTALIRDGTVGLARLEPTSSAALAASGRDESTEERRLQAVAARVGAPQTAVIAVGEVGDEGGKSDVQPELAPDFVGKSARAALVHASRQGIVLTMTGSGIVVEQTPKAGARLKADAPLVLVLADATAVSTLRPPARAGGGKR